MSAEKRPENWKAVPGHPRYEVSDQGEVRTAAGVALKRWSKQGGYQLVRFTDFDRTRSVQMVHRLVAYAFIPNPENLPCVNHLDNNPSNNMLENLEWCTQKQNLEHMTRQGRRVCGSLGKRSPKAALMDWEADLVKRMYALGTHSYSGLASIFGLHKRTIGRIINGESYKPVRLPLPAPPEGEV